MLLEISPTPLLGDVNGPWRLTISGWGIHDDSNTTAENQFHLADFMLGSTPKLSARPALWFHTTGSIHCAPAPICQMRDMKSRLLGQSNCSRE